MSKKTVLEMFKDIKELETADGPSITVEDILPFFCKQVDEALQCLEILKPLCEVYETPAKKLKYLKVRGVVVYEFKNTEEYELFKGWLDE